MNLKKIAVLSALALTLTMGLMIFGGQRVQAAGTWYVNSTTGNDSFTCMSAVTPCKTINAAIGKASSGDTIIVAAGLYSESVAINRTLTLLGAQANVDARTRAGAESTIDNSCSPVAITADNVTLNGFTVQGSTQSDPCLIAGIWMNPGFGGGNGSQILYNIVQNNVAGIELDNTGTFQAKVQFNWIRNNNNPGPNSGSGIEVSFGLNNAVIDNNRFSGQTSDSMTVQAPSSGVTISNNELVGGTSEGFFIALLSSSSITGNTSVGSTSYATIDLFGGNDGVTITCNLLATGQRAISVDDPYGVGPNKNITAHNNNIQGNVVAGLQVDTGAYVPGILNAENNWWGSPTGPTSTNNASGTGDKVIDPDNAVDFFPYLTSPSTCAAVLQVGPPTNKDQCKKDGWMNFNVPRKFKNQGDCVSYVSNGK
ncbi:MAG: hypothetical protein QOH70_2659 [Blastocatellia bacterium]|jgi:nitrous oxidase accessory protein NosD|nr:hypothetical protein [Blastocatellia bacterium]